MQQQPRLPLWFLVANFALIATAFVVGVSLAGRSRNAYPEPQSAALDLIYQEILRSHVEPQDGQALLDRAIGAMVGGLDDYSQYVPPTKVAQYEENSTGRYEGVGMVMRLHEQDVVVHFPFAGGPAERAGVRPGDRLLAVDGKMLADLAVDNRNSLASDLVRGPANTKVALRFGRDDGEVELSVERASVQRPAVKWTHLVNAEHRIGYVHVTDFHRGVASQVDLAIRSLQQQAPLRGLILDLRFDGGGSLDECVALARLFQPTGNIVSTRRRGSEIERVDAVLADCKYAELPLVILVNEDSASASEVFAGCLQDHQRATVVGLRTYGKGVVNTVYSWQQFKLKLTTAHYYTPNGRSLGDPHRSRNTTTVAADAPGITPDIEAPVTEEQRRAILAGLVQHEVPAAHLAAFTALAQRHNIPVPSPPNGASDPQLEKALAAMVAQISPANGK